MDTRVLVFWVFFVCLFAIVLLFVFGRFVCLFVWGEVGDWVVR